MNPINCLNSLFEQQRNVLILIARIALVIIFLYSGWGKLTDFSGTVGYFTALSIPLPSVAAAIAVFMEVGVALALLLGIQVRICAFLFVLFTLGTAFFGHAYWAQEGAARASNLLSFYKNISIAGGLLLLCVTGSGRFALKRD